MSSPQKKKKSNSMTNANRNKVNFLWRFSATMCCVCGACASMAAAQSAATTAMAKKPAEMENTAILLATLAALVFVPFAILMLTSFVKISIVIAVLRNALGVRDIPSNLIAVGVSLILTVFVMSPVIEQMYRAAGAEATFDEAGIGKVFIVAERGREPLRQFLERNSSDADRALFLDLARRLAIRNQIDSNGIQATDFRVVAPAFLCGQLNEAFQIGFFLFLPFLVIDLTVASILQSLGMIMLPPTQVSLPFKLLLFIMIGGWSLLLKNLILGYA
jgi:type III secretion protein R